MKTTLVCPYCRNTVSVDCPNLNGGSNYTKCSTCPKCHKTVRVTTDGRGSIVKVAA